MNEMTNSNDDNRSENQPHETAQPQWGPPPADARQPTAAEPPAYGRAYETDRPHETSPGGSGPGVPQAPAGVKGGLRAVGFGVLGFIGGIILAFLIQDLIGIIVAVRGGGFPIEVAIVIGMLMPLIGAGGAVAAILIDRRIQKRRLARQRR